MLNNTERADSAALIFNRVPKSGSEMLWGLIDKLQVPYAVYIKKINASTKEVETRRGLMRPFVVNGLR